MANELSPKARNRRTTLHDVVSRLIYARQAITPSKSNVDKPSCAMPGIAMALSRRMKGLPIYRSNNA